MSDTNALNGVTYKRTPPFVVQNEPQALSESLLNPKKMGTIDTYRRKTSMDLLKCSESYLPFKSILNDTNGAVLTLGAQSFGLSQRPEDFGLLGSFGVGKQRFAWQDYSNSLSRPLCVSLTNQLRLYNYYNLEDSKGDSAYLRNLIDTIGRKPEKTKIEKFFDAISGKDHPSSWSNWQRTENR